VERILLTGPSKSIMLHGHYSTVTLFAKFLGLSTSVPFTSAT
jgi:hypothetical protein